MGCFLYQRGDSSRGTQPVRRRVVECYGFRMKALPLSLLRQCNGQDCA